MCVSIFTSQVTRDWIKLSCAPFFLHQKKDLSLFFSFFSSLLFVFPLCVEQKLTKTTFFFTSSLAVIGRGYSLKNAVLRSN